MRRWDEVWNGVFPAYLWYPALKRPAWEGPGIDSDIMRGRVRKRCDGGDMTGGMSMLGRVVPGIFWELGDGGFARFARGELTS